MDTTKTKNEKDHHSEHEMESRVVWGHRRGIGKTEVVALLGIV